MCVCVYLHVCVIFLELGNIKHKNDMVLTSNIMILWLSQHCIKFQCLHKIWLPAHLQAIEDFLNIVWHKSLTGKNFDG